MNGIAFYGNTKLNLVYLHGNDCIDEDFDATKITTIHSTLDAKCNFDAIKQFHDFEFCKIKVVENERKIAKIEAELKLTKQMLDDLRANST